MVATREEVLEALRKYREHVAARNRYALELYVSLAEYAEAPDENDFPGDDLEAEIAEARMLFLEHFTGGTLTVPFKVEVEGKGEVLCKKEPDLPTPADVLLYYDQIAAEVGLDGTWTSRSPPYSEERRRSELTAYVEGMEAWLREHCIPEVRDFIKFPEELLVVAEQVNRVHGPGLHSEQQQQSVPFWNMAEKTPSSTLSIEELAMHTSCSRAEELVVGAGWQSGSRSKDSHCYFIFCREPTISAEVNDGEKKKEKTPWSWKYVCEMGFNPNVFDSIPEFLDFYKDAFAVDTEVYPEYGPGDVWNNL
ncbi:FAD-linked oxidoreductase ZEB1 [Apiospora arundinis]